MGNINSLLSNIEFQDKLCDELGFNKLGCGWFEKEDRNIRIRLWKDNEVDF